MTVYRTNHVEAYLAKENLATIMVFHDDFNRHETYVAARQKDGDLFFSIVSVAGEDELTVRMHNTGPQAIAYLMSVACATFAACTPDGEQLTTELEIAGTLKQMAVDHVLYNLKDGYLNNHVRDMAIKVLES